MITKNNRETILSSSFLDPLGHEVADLLMADRGLKLESLFNLLGEMRGDILDLNDQVCKLQREVLFLKKDVKFIEQSL